VGDIGQIECGDSLFIVSDTKKQGDAHLHIGSLEKGSLQIGDKVSTRVDATARNATIRNHSATHLMHSALRHVLGEHVQQKGSLVEPARLRFDFSHYEALTPEQIAEIEAEVNQQIQLNLDAESKLMGFDDAIAAGALAFFDEKYGDKVRVLSFGDYSTELCGGTHVKRVGDIGFFKITSESGIAAGVRRIEAVTGTGALQWALETDALLSDLAKQLRTGKSSLADKLGQTLDKQRSLEKEIKQLKSQLAGAQSSDLLNDAVEVNGIKVLAKKVDETDANALRDTVDQIRNKLGKAVILLVAETEDGKVRLVAGVSKAESKQLKAGELVNLAAQHVGGKGGGRPDMAMAGGTQPENIPQALALVKEWVKQKLA
ncbi:MAG: alanine--tRNA ligase, partial [Gammaproteobacteria bacterium]|nr:alanine--tRNA ligase [Gammaproteobacteria bacterium]